MMMSGMQIVHQLFQLLLICSSLCCVKNLEYDLMGQGVQNIAVDEKQNLIYIGARDYVYVANYSLIPKYQIPTNKNSEINQNIILLVTEDSLLECGSILNGSCNMRDLTNISVVKHSVTGKESQLKRGIFVSILTKSIADVKRLSEMDNIIIAKSYDIHNNAKIMLFNKKLTCPCEGDSNINCRCGTIDYKVDHEVFFKTFIKTNDSFIYLLTNHRSSDSSYIPKLTQFCLDSQSLHSYIDVPLLYSTNQNTKLQTKYNFVQFSASIRLTEEVKTLFPFEIQNEGENSVMISAFSHEPNTPREKTALCLMLYSEIKQRMYDVRLKTFDTCVTNSTEFTRQMKNNYIMYHGETPCKYRRVVNETLENACYDQKVDLKAISKIVGPDSEAIKCYGIHTETEYNFTVTAMLVHDIDEFTIVLIGTSDGYVRKFHIKNAKEYDVEEIDKGYPIKDLVLIENYKYLLVLTQNKLVKLLLEKCEDYSNMSACYGSKDPICGWCILEQKCTSRKHCSTSGVNQWIPAGSDKRPQIKLTPNSHWIKSTTVITIELENVPILSELIGGYEYKFMLGSTPINCTPQSAGVYSWNLPENPTEEQKRIDLYLKNSTKNIWITVTAFYFYDCSLRQSCATCNGRGSFYPISCAWCDYQKCENAATNCDASTINITKLDDCPMITVPEKKIQSGENMKLQLSGKNLPSKNNYKCEFTNAASSVVGATWNNETSLTCESATFQYDGNGSTHDMQVEVTLGNVQVDPENTGTGQHVELYKCQYLGEDCCSCVDLDEQYKCNWSKTGGSGSCIFTTTSNPPAQCEAVVYSIFPENGTLCGNTELEIEGKNFDCTGDHNKLKEVRLGNNLCKINTASLTESRIICRTPQVSKEETGNLNIKKNQGAAYPQKDVSFSYKTGSYTGLTPKNGPIAGGTILNITGKGLNVGGKRTVFLNDSSGTRIDCKLLTGDTYPHYLSCEVQVPKTSVELKPNDSMSVYVNHDDFCDVRLDDSFVFKPNPSALSFFPQKSFMSGGRAIKITGKNLEYIQEAYAFIAGKPDSQENCTYDESLKMFTCPSPPANDVNGLGLQRRRKRSTGCDANGIVTYKFDAFKCGFTIEYVIDPTFYNLTDGEKKQLEDGNLLIRGANLTLAMSKEDLEISIGGNSICRVDSLDESSILCFVPDDVEGNTEQQVVVKAGKITVNVGVIVIKKEGLNMLIIYICAAVLGLLIGIIFVILFVWRRKTVSMHKNLQEKQDKLEELQMTVIAQCREAFADLQTDMTDVKGDLVAAGFPYRDVKQFVFNVVFPTECYEDCKYLKPNSNQSRNELLNTQNAMNTLEQLCQNKFFLLTVIQTLEKQKRFHLKDKANVASLISILLLERMDYFADILCILLNEHIEKNVNKKTLKTLFQRSETITDKMLQNWLAISSYSYLKNCVGAELFILCKATQLMMEKSPIDAVTGNSRATLMEEKLIRENINPTLITLFVNVNEDEFTCKVLDCDTITQVKSKCLGSIYKTIPASQVPKPEKVDLEWRQGQSGRLLLHDDDVTSETEGQWRRLNTLQHYNVTSGSKMALLLREFEDPDDNLEIYANLTNASHPAPVDANNVHIDIDADQQENKDLIHNNESSSQLEPWHLIKPEDECNTKPTKAISELFLSRLLQTKGTLKEYVDSFFQLILSTESLPLAVKYMYGFLDEKASKFGQDSDIANIWKSNSYPLRFLAALITRPEIFFDMDQPDYVNNCLEVIAEVFIETFSPTAQKISKNSSSQKLLFFKEITNYRREVRRYYKEVMAEGEISQADLHNEMDKISREQNKNLEYNKLTILQDLFEHIKKYKDDVIYELSENQDTCRLQLDKRLEALIDDSNTA